MKPRVKSYHAWFTACFITNMYFRCRNFRVEKLLRISQIWAWYAKGYPCEKKSSSWSAKVNPRKKSQTRDLRKLIQKNFTILWTDFIYVDIYYLLKSIPSVILNRKHLPSQNFHKSLSTQNFPVWSNCESLSSHIL